jgi:hypothetical protein
LAVAVAEPASVEAVAQVALFTNHRYNYLQQRILSRSALVAAVNPVTTALLLQETLHPL